MKKNTEKVIDGMKNKRWVTPFLGFMMASGVVFLSVQWTFPAIAASDGLGQGYDFAGNGKRKFPCFEATYQSQKLSEDDQPIRFHAADFKLALQQQANVLAQRPQGAELKRLSELLMTLPSVLTLQDLTRFETHLLRGEDGCGNTHFTAYFSPVIQVSSKPQGEYIHPLYALPTGLDLQKPLTRAMIDQEKALAGKGLELGYSNSLLTNFFLQVQGSGMAEYIDTGERLTLQYAGQNGLKYSSVGRYLVSEGHIPAEEISLDSIRRFFDQNPDKLMPFLSQNESYVFFKKAHSGPQGSLSTEVVPQVSIAVDPAFIPLGSVVLAEIPRLDAQGRFLGHQLTLLVAQDTGGAIRGPGHVDLYMGAGLEAQQKASAMHHYGRLWLLKEK